MITIKRDGRYLDINEFIDSVMPPNKLDPQTYSIEGLMYEGLELEQLAEDMNS